MSIDINGGDRFPFADVARAPNRLALRLRLRTPPYKSVRYLVVFVPVLVFPIFGYGDVSYHSFSQKRLRAEFETVRRTIAVDHVRRFDVYVRLLGGMLTFGFGLLRQKCRDCSVPTDELSVSNCDADCALDRRSRQHRGETRHSITV